jgi:hypothetical protein
MSFNFVTLKLIRIFYPVLFYVLILSQPICGVQMKQYLDVRMRINLIFPATVLFVFKKLIEV